MNILYIVGEGSTWDNNELRYSLRSLAKYGKNVDNVYLVGYKPDFVSDKAHFIPCDDPFDHKHKNILNKVIKAAEGSDIGRHFLVSSDDHYYIRETDFENYPVYYRNKEIPATFDEEYAFDRYCLSLQSTRMLLEKNGLPIYQTNPHCNTHWDMDVYEKYVTLFYSSLTKPFGCEMNCLMGNMLIKDGATPEPFHDAKMPFDVTPETWEQYVGDTNCISSLDDVKFTYTAEWLEKEFPNKCKYEK